MKKTMIVCFIVFAIKGFCQKSNTVALNIGDKVPESVWKKIPKHSGTKLVLLDFWSTWCTSCFDAFPKMEELQKKFSKELQIVLVNPYETESTIKERLSKINNRNKSMGEGLMVLSNTLLRIIGDMEFHYLFPATGVPHHVWINNKGIVQYITDGYNATEKKVQAVLNGEPVKMHVKDDVLGKQLAEKGLLQPFHKVASKTYYSAFSQHLDVGISGGIEIDTVNNLYRNLIFNTNVINLYRTAFSHEGADKNYRERLWIEVADTDLYTIPIYYKDYDRIDEWRSKYSFTYELQLPLEEMENFQEKMQIDLNYFFGKKFGIEGFKERRKLKSLILVKTGDGKLGSTNNDSRSVIKDDHLLLVNNEFYNFTGILSSLLEGTERPIPVIDETGISPDFKIDLEIKGSVRNVENIRKQLKRYGLDLVEGEREVEVLVIRDKKIEE